MSQLLPASVAIGWSALWLNFVVIYFYNVKEKLHKDYVNTGTLDQAKSYIESTKLIPSLAELVDLVIAKKDRTKADTSEVLVEADYLSVLSRAEAATREKTLLDDTLRQLESSAKKLWRLGLFHILFTIALWVLVVFYTPSSDTPATTQPVLMGQVWETARLATVSMGVLWLLSFGFTGWYLFWYDKRRDDFLNSLKVNR